MAQLVVRISEELLSEIDALVAAGVFDSRSDAARRGLERLADESRRQRVAEEIAEGYRRIPETEEELRWAKDQTLRMIEEEPW